MRNSRTTTNGFINKRMDDGVYAQRRVVMDLLYRAKSLLKANGIEIPRVDIRITTREAGETACGKARMNANIIWIPADYLRAKYLYQIVLHELCHALWGVQHDLKCKLMHTNVQAELTDDMAEEIFVKYAKMHCKV